MAVLVLLAFLVCCVQGAQDSASIGREWITNSGPGGQGYSVTFGGGKFVAAGAVGAIAISTNGHDWTKTAQLDARFTDISYGLGRYIAVGTNGALFTSTNGTRWELHLRPATNAFEGAFGTDNHLFAVGAPGPIEGGLKYGGLVLFTSDGQNWREAIFPNKPPLSSVVRSGSRVAAIGSKYWFDDRLVVSDDAEAWREPSTSAEVGRWFDIAFGNDIFVAAGSAPRGPRMGQIGSPRYEVWATQISTNGIDWRYAGAPGEFAPTGWDPTTVGTFESIAFGMGKFVAVGSWTAVSTNGIDWEHFKPRVATKSIAYGPGCFVAAGITRFYVSGRLQSQPYLPLDALKPQADGTVRGRVETERNAVVHLRQSSDLLSWGNEIVFTNTSGSAEFVLPGKQGSASSYVSAKMRAP